jgi:hypothetical protein
LGAHGEHAIHPHLVTHPDEPIRSLEAAAKVIRHRTGDYLDATRKICCNRLSTLRRCKRPMPPERPFAPGAEAQGLLLVPPEDGKSA